MLAPIGVTQRAIPRVVCFLKQFTMIGHVTFDERIISDWMLNVADRAIELHFLNHDITSLNVDRRHFVLTASMVV